METESVSKEEQLISQLKKSNTFLTQALTAYRSMQELFGAAGRFEEARNISLLSDEVIVILQENDFVIKQDTL